MNKGFTKFDNTLLEAIMRADFNGTEMKVIITIVRYTAGYQRTVGTLSAACISVLTGKSLRCVKYALKSLTEKNVISKFTENGVNSYSVNDVTTWKDYENLHLCSEINSTDAVKSLAPRPVQRVAHNKDNINKYKYNFKDQEQKFSVPTPKPTKFNNFKPSGNIDYKRLEMDALKRQLKRLKNSEA